MIIRALAVFGFLLVAAAFIAGSWALHTLVVEVIP